LLLLCSCFALGWETVSGLHGPPPVCAVCLLYHTMQWYAHDACWLHAQSGPALPGVHPECTQQATGKKFVRCSRAFLSAVTPVVLWCGEHARQTGGSDASSSQIRFIYARLLLACICCRTHVCTSTLQLTSDSTFVCRHTSLPLPTQQASGRALVRHSTGPPRSSRPAHAAGQACSSSARPAVAAFSSSASVSASWLSGLRFSSLARVTPRSLAPQAATAYTLAACQARPAPRRLRGACRGRT